MMDQTLAQDEFLSISFKIPTANVLEPNERVHLHKGVLIAW